MVNNKNQDTIIVEFNRKQLKEGCRVHCSSAYRDYCDKNDKKLIWCNLHYNWIDFKIKEQKNGK